MPPGQDSPYRGNYASLPVVTLKPPSEGNRTVPVVILWQRDGVSPSYTIHFNARAQQVVSLSQIAALHIDNTQCSSTINIVFPDTQFQLQLGPNSEGFYPVVTNSLEFYAYIDLAPTINDRSVIQVLNFLPPPIEFGSAGGAGVGAGTVRQVDTVAPLQGGPITDQGTLSLTVPLPLNIGGTGAITANAALDNLSNTSGATAGSLSRSAGGNWTVSAGAGSGTISAVNPGTGLTGGGTSGAVTLGLQVPVTIANGGTGAITAGQALTNLAAAPLAAPAFTGAPTAPTAAPGTNTTQLATTAFVTAATLTAGGAFVPLTGAVPMSGRLDISQNATIPAAPNALLHATQNNNLANHIVADTFGTGVLPDIQLRNSRGTAAARTALQNTDVLGSYTWHGYDGAGYALGAQIYASALENWTGSAHGTVLNFNTTALGQTATAFPMTLAQGLMLGVPLASDPGPGSIAIAGILLAGGDIHCTAFLATGVAQLGGILSHAGVSGSYGANQFNFQWSGVPILWVDAVNVGTIQVVASDERLKTDIKPSSADALAALNNLDIVEYDIRLSEDHDPQHHSVGFTAQQLKELIPEAVTASDDPDEMLGVQLLPVVSHLIRAVQQLSAQVSELQAKVQQ